ncbi:Methyltransferase FkbM family [Mesorhizobium prunaredense]|uniref:Methyltransferase FkbM family n=1 Tax=Mesorhizobium prunaredense TaxID=1631249 RepID=A0A1R3VH13_9HYPH|nr:FkbM family methyltransferase [Mesorhizobium prunaredense]SIT58140.1 Methyltransferase FkbM family [Mesorhizobium prunaredense]
MTVGPITRLRSELSALFKVVPFTERLRYLASILRALPSVLGRRTLAPADALMRHDVKMYLNGQVVTIPVGDVSRLLAGKDYTPTFGGIREMYASNVYLRAFRPGIVLRNVVDLGGNRGLFSLLAVKAYGADLAVSVEPVPHFGPVLKRLAEANQIALTRLPREEKFASATAGDDRVTIPDLMERYGLKEIDFIKCDIEGGEFDVFAGDPAWLRKVRNIALEMHPAKGSCAKLIETLERAGYSVLPTDQFGARVGTDGPHYLYASRTGDLVDAIPA